jgi:hypothetical protein
MARLVRQRGHTIFDKGSYVCSLVVCIMLSFALSFLSRHYPRSPGTCKKLSETSVASLTSQCFNMTDLEGGVAAANSGASIEIPKTPETIQVPNSPQKPQYDLPNLEYQLGLIKRKEEALKLRTAKVKEERADKMADLMTRIVQRLNQEDLIRTKEEQTRKERMEEIENLKVNLDQYRKEERGGQSKEGMVQELFEEDAERIKAELGARIERLKAGEQLDAGSEHASAGHGTLRKRKASFDDIEEPRTKQMCVLVAPSQPETESDDDSRDSQAVGRSTQSQATVSAPAQRPTQRAIQPHLNAQSTAEAVGFAGRVSLDLSGRMAKAFVVIVSQCSRCCGRSLAESTEWTIQTQSLMRRQWEGDRKTGYCAEWKHLDTEPHGVTEEGRKTSLQKGAR